MTTLRVSDYLDDLRRSVTDIRLITGGLDLPTLSENRIAQLALVKAIENIGEAARNLLRDHADYADRTQSVIPWRRWVAVRNRLAHGYFAINLAIVWDLVASNIPDLDKELDRLVADLPLD